MVAGESNIQGRQCDLLRTSEILSSVVGDIVYQNPHTINRSTRKKFHITAKSAIIQQCLYVLIEISIDHELLILVAVILNMLGNLFAQFFMVCSSVNSTKLVCQCSKQTITVSWYDVYIEFIF